uniref:Uncharacterized protein n=1 Tax=Anguilla anguilla TaxID=7936 RepID=A0A0E9RG81_ANGAN
MLKKSFLLAQHKCLKLRISLGLNSSHEYSYSLTWRCFFSLIHILCMLWHALQYMSNDMNDVLCV